MGHKVNTFWFDTKQRSVKLKRLQHDACGLHYPVSNIGVSITYV